MTLNKMAENFVLSKIKNIKHGSLKLINYDGKVYQFGDVNSNLSSDIKVNNPKFYFNIIVGGGSALGEAHINRDFDSTNLTTLIEITAKNIETIYSFSGKFKLQKIKSILKKIFLSNTKSNSKVNIAKHYDLGNDFFSLWLDKTLTYSSAIFKDKDADLEESQKNKYQKIIDKLDVKEGEKILEIGCGWGGFSNYLVKKYNVLVDCITISKKQFEFTKRKVLENGLNNNINVKFLDYRDLEEKYDKIVSIEMIEAVGEKYLDEYFKTIKKSLKGGGKAAIQAIVIKDELFERYRNEEDFIQKYIFPGGFLPSLNLIKQLIANNELKLDKLNFYSKDYAKTLSIWKKNFLTKWSKISPLGFDESFKKMWEFYLSYCEAGFKTRNIDLIQISMSNK